MDITMSVCDVCEEHVPATQDFKITRGRAVRHVDLCDRHAEPILEAFSKGHIVGASTRRPAVKRTGALPVTKMEDVK